MEPIVYIDRATGKEEEEKVYGAKALNFLYGDGWSSRIFGTPLMYLLSRIPFFSACYGIYQKMPWTKAKIAPFIQTFQIDTSEFETQDFESFNDFFTRKLKMETRPIAEGEKRAVIPADGRYLFYPNIAEADGFFVKGQKFNLETLLADSKLAEKYHHGTMVVGRLCPSDYHRFHFPCACVPGESRLINGWLFSVNPTALKKDIHIFTQNKRSICELHTKHFGNVLYIEIGATNVGSIHETYTPFLPYPKGAEKGYFSFGASALIVLFQPGTIKLDDDLLGRSPMEIKCLLGQSLGVSFSPAENR
jgi:phosphatidylserine decarboxylase